MAKNPATTKTRLLDTAERLFASRGIEACSVREIVASARANLGAITYHFGSKNDLARAVIQRRLGPLHRERLRLLEEAESSAGPGGPTLESILEAGIAPTIRLLREKPDFMKIVGELLTSPRRESLRPPEAEAILERFMAAIARAVPRVSKHELAWRMHFIRGAIIHTWTTMGPLGTSAHLGCAGDSPERIVERLVTFAAAGLRADPGERRLAAGRSVPARRSR